MDPSELRFRTQQSPRSDATTMNSLVSPPRNRLSQTFQHPPQAQDPRSNLSRRFTADSGRVPTLSTNMGPHGPSEQEYHAMSMQSMQPVFVPPGSRPDERAEERSLQLIAKKKMEFEKIREKKRFFEGLFEAEMAKQEVELSHMIEEHGKLSGHQSEPTTPPEYRESTTGFPSMLSRPNRYSLSSLMSPQGMASRTSRSGSVLASPQSGIPMSRFAFDDQVPAWSQQTSRRNSDEDEKEEAVRQDPTSHRSTNAVNRYSMPVTKSRTAFYDISSLDQANTTGFLFGDDDTTPETKLYAQNTPEDNFPTLIRRDPNTSSVVSEASNISTRPANTYRHSLELKMDHKFAEVVSDAAPAGNNSNTLITPPKLQNSLSANDVPTMKTVSGASVGSTPNHAAQQHLQNHHAHMGRIPAGALPNRHSRELSADGRDNNGAGMGYQSINSTLHATAAPFGPVMPQTPVHLQGSGLVGNQIPQSQSGNPLTPANTLSAFNCSYTPPGYNNGLGYGAGAQAPFTPMNGSVMNGTTPYSMNQLAMQMGGMSVNGNSNWSNPMSVTYQPMFSPPQRDSQARVIQSRRQQDTDAVNRYNQPIDHYRGHIYELCKDQHGCRYLQKQLENKNPADVHKIWLETKSHVVELMIDPFGNYLCQKLFEFCNDAERTVLVKEAAKDMVRIALNQHGTRALQKMIENVTTQEQVQEIIGALRWRVVDLIQDINGNHVIQKCLNKLSPLDSQFIFDAVANSCVEVGGHRHGCCVLQRCIDHAHGNQKVQIIRRIIENAVVLIQDPFGNYVVQYIIDLGDPMFTEPLVAQLRGRIMQLSCHKFSSNVIEKCLRCASDNSKDMIVQELVAPGELEQLMRDSFGNYVVQTALEHATPHMKNIMASTIRPVLPAIRTTPYGRKIQAKITIMDNAAARLAAGQVTPVKSQTLGQAPIETQNEYINSQEDEPKPDQGQGTQGAMVLASPTPVRQGGANANGNRGGQNLPVNNTGSMRPPRQQTFNRTPGGAMSRGITNGSPAGLVRGNGGFAAPAAMENNEQNFF